MLLCCNWCLTVSITKVQAPAVLLLAIRARLLHCNRLFCPSFQIHCSAGRGAGLSNALVPFAVKSSDFEIGSHINERRKWNSKHCRQYTEGYSAE